MITSIFSPENYHIGASVAAFFTAMLIPLGARYVLYLIPAFKQVRDLNKEAADSRGNRLNYPAIQKRSKIWGLLTHLGIFTLIIPFSITTESQAWWQIPLDIFVILMFYDFFYYLVHRFLFHENGAFKGPLVWVHAVHHRQKNPCRMDSNYLHPLETCIGLSLYGASIGVLAMMMGDFHIVTIVITAIAFSEINQHNHDLMEADHFPFKYLKYAADMHHVHHARFTSGNYATISLLYDWMFGTLDKGQGYKKR